MADSPRRSRSDPWESYEAEPFLRNPIVMILGALILGLASLVLLLWITDDDDTQLDTAEQASVTTEASTRPSDTESADTTDGAEDTNAANTNTADTNTADTKTAIGPYVEATLQDQDFVLQGVVPTASLASNYLRSAEIAYSPFVRSELMVDEELDPAEWLSEGPEAIVLLPIITDGTIRIVDGEVELSGRSPTTERVQKLEGALAQVTGLPVAVGEMVITDLSPPSLSLVSAGGSIELQGTLPSDDIRQSIVAGAETAYGPSQVDDRIEVDPGVFTALWMYSGGPLLQAMSVFPQYELVIDGTEFSGFINGGVTFEPNSAEFSGDYARVLDVGVAVLTRDQSLQLVIEGHTDSDGPAEVNLALSQSRAEAVMQYFVDNGIAPERLTAIGKGESEPATANDTPEGRALNRRIQYVLTSSQ